jgi:hypothetical protein
MEVSEKWEYTKADLSLLPKRGDELDILNSLGQQGWELVVITLNSVAYMKRLIEDNNNHKKTAARKKPTSSEAK